MNVSQITRYYGFHFLETGNPTKIESTSNWTQYCPTFNRWIEMYLHISSSCMWVCVCVPMESYNHNKRHQMFNSNAAFDLFHLVGVILLLRNFFGSSELLQIFHFYWMQFCWVLFFPPVYHDTDWNSIELHCKCNHSAEFQALHWRYKMQFDALILYVTNSWNSAQIFTSWITCK